MINIDLTKEKGLEISFTGQVIGADGTALNEMLQNYYTKEEVEEKIKSIQGYTYISTATPSTTPVTLTGDEKVFYIATDEGNYSNFRLGNINELSVIKSENGNWKVEGLGVNNYMELRENAHGDLFFADEQGNVLLELNNGHIKTKKFDSENIKIGFDIDIEDDVLVISKI